MKAASTFNGRQQFQNNNDDIANDMPSHGMVWHVMAWRGMACNGAFDLRDFIL